MAEIGDILEERGKRYGKFKGHAMIAQTLKDCIRGDLMHGAASTSEADVEACAAAVKEKWLALQPDQREALEMIMHKVGRIMNGDPDYADSWADIAGYAKLVTDRLEGIER